MVHGVVEDQPTCHVFIKLICLLIRSAAAKVNQQQIQFKYYCVWKGHSVQQGSQVQMSRRPLRPQSFYWRLQYSIQKQFRNILIYINTVY